MSFEIQIPYFTGPFDLLLFFIERDELDIRDIPISKITNDFLSYVKLMEQKQLEIGSEFILVAATLMSVKAKMLLPRTEIDDAGNEIDPREDFIKHLIEYKKYKSIIGEFIDLESKRMLLEKRGNIARELKSIGEKSNVEHEIQDIDLYKLLKVYTKVMHKFENEQSKPIHRVVPYAYTVEHQKDWMVEQVKLVGKLPFTDMMHACKEKILVIFNFLAILELLQLQQLTIVIGEGYNNFWLEEKKNIEVA